MSQSIGYDSTRGRTVRSERRKTEERKGEGKRTRKWEMNRKRQIQKHLRL